MHTQIHICEQFLCQTYSGRQLAVGDMLHFSRALLFWVFRIEPSRLKAIRLSKVTLLLLSSTKLIRLLFSVELIIDASPSFSIWLAFSFLPPVLVGCSDFRSWSFCFWEWWHKLTTFYYKLVRLGMILFVHLLYFLPSLNQR